MNTSSVLAAVFLVVAALVTPYAALGQHGFAFTKTVDPSGEADFTSIQDAIDACFTPGADERYTVLIYAGVYDDEALTLGVADPRIDLVGVDRDAVIIKPPADTDAITIEGFGARNNTIRNLTIITDDDDEDQGRGIVIKKPDQGTGDDPSAIKIIGVTIQCDGDDSNGLDVEDSATDVEIRNTRITTADGYGIRIVDSEKSTEAPRNVLLHDLMIQASGRDRYAIRAKGTEGVPAKQRLRVVDLLLYDEAPPSEPDRGAGKP